MTVCYLMWLPHEKKQCFILIVVREEILKEVSIMNFLG